VSTLIQKSAADFLCAPVERVLKGLPLRPLYFYLCVLKVNHSREHLQLKLLRQRP